MKIDWQHRNLCVWPDGIWHTHVAMATGVPGFCCGWRYGCAPPFLCVEHPTLSWKHEISWDRVPPSWQNSLQPPWTDPHPATPPAETWVHHQHASRKWHHRRRLNTASTLLYSWKGWTWELLFLHWVFIQMWITFKSLWRFVKAELIVNKIRFYLSFDSIKASSVTHTSTWWSRDAVLVIHALSSAAGFLSKRPIHSFPTLDRRIFLPTIIASVRLSSSVFRHIFHVLLREASVCEALSQQTSRKWKFHYHCFSNQTQTIETEMVVITDNKQADFTFLKWNEASFANVPWTHLHNKRLRLWIGEPSLSVTIYKRYRWIMACTHVNLNEGSCLEALPVA